MPTSQPATFWREQIAHAKDVRALYERWWEANLRAYAPGVQQDPAAYGGQVNTNRDVTLVERKKADLFYQQPEVTLVPNPMFEGPLVDPNRQPVMGPPDQSGQPTPIPMAMALAAHQAIVNEKLGMTGANVTRVVHETLFDVLALSGTGWTKMGYESTTVPQTIADPVTGEPRTVEVPIEEHCFWTHFSPKQALIPHTFRSTQWDKAPWLGYQFELPLTKALRERYHLPEDFQGSGQVEQWFDHGVGARPDTARVCTGVEIWYRSALYRDDVQHPDHLTQLVLVDGVEEPVIEQDSPYQTLDESGALTPNSLIGYPIHPLTLRTITDSAYQPSDCTLIRPLVNELNRFREQMVEYRDAQTLRWVYNADTLPRESIEKIVRSPIGGMIGVPSEAFLGEGAIKELPHGSMPRESFTSNDYIDNDIARTTAIDASGAGVQSTGSTTATEQQIISANANARLDFERGIVLQWYIAGVTKFSTLVQRYVTVRQAAQIVGETRAQIWETWRQTADSTVAFTAMPDSALRVDQAVDRRQAQELYSFLANDPFIAKGRAKLLERLLRKFHIDPDGIVQAPDPPRPDPPKVSLSFKGEDLVGPQAPIVIEILQQQGVQISPDAIQLSQQVLAQAAAAADAAQLAAPETRHGGKLAEQESLSKHAADETGHIQNTQSPGAMGRAGGMLQ